MFHDRRATAQRIDANVCVQQIAHEATTSRRQVKIWRGRQSSLIGSNERFVVNAHFLEKSLRPSSRFQWLEDHEFTVCAHPDGMACESNAFGQLHGLIGSDVKEFRNRHAWLRLWLSHNIQLYVECVARMDTGFGRAKA